MSVVRSTLDIARFLRERKGIKEEKSRYGTEQEALGKERRLREDQIRQGLNIELQQAEREKARMSPGGIETKKILSAPYGIGVEEARPKVIPEGIGHRRERLQGSLAEKQIAGYETPAQQRTGEQDWEKKMAAIKQQYALELASLKG